MRFPEAVEGAVYLLVGEACANALKHSGASHVAIRLQRRDGALAVAVIDADCGFEVGAVAGSGLDGLRDRIEALGGQFEVQSSLGSGTWVIAELPVGRVSA